MSRLYECWVGDCDKPAAKPGRWKLCEGHQAEKDASEQAIRDAAAGTAPLAQVEAQRQAHQQKWIRP